MTRIRLAGSELRGFEIPLPAASVRLLLPVAGALVLPTWHGNEFLLPDGQRAPIRTFTPRRFDAAGAVVDIDVVHHDGGLASAWAVEAEVGSPAAVSGPGRGYIISDSASRYVLAGDETAIPAICQLLEHLPERPISVHIEVRKRSSVVDLHRDVEEKWLVTGESGDGGRSLVEAVSRENWGGSTHLWAAGEAQAMHSLRKAIHGDRGVSRDVATIRGYWKRRA